MLWEGLKLLQPGQWQAEKAVWTLSGPRRLRKRALGKREVAQEPQGRLEVEWRLLQGPKALLRAKVTGRPRAPPGPRPAAPKWVRVRPGFPRGLGMKSAHQMGLLVREAGGDGGPASEAMLPGALRRSYS